MPSITRRSRILIAALAAPLVIAACAKGGDEEQAAVTGDTTAMMAPAPAPAPAAAPAAGAVTDPQIAAIVVAANAADSAAGVLAVGKATNPNVKAFAQQMVTDHGGVNQQAVQLVTRLGVTPEENGTSQGLAQGGQETRARLEGLSGAEFDRAYVDNEVTYHETVLGANDQTHLPNAQNAELKALLEQVRPAIAAHLEHAKRLQTELAGS